MIVKLPLRGPTKVGLNVTCAVQLAPMAKLLGEAGQLFVLRKSPATTIELIVSVDVPLLVMTTGCGALVVLSVWLGNVSEVGVNCASP